MTQKKQQSSTSSRRRYLIGGGLLLAAASIMVCLNLGVLPVAAPTEASTQKSAKVESARSPRVDHRAGPSGQEDSHSDRSARRRAADGGSPEGGSFPQIERILADSSQTTEQAAEQLLAIVQRPELSEDERYEAMAHGLNLSFKTFAAAAADPALPAPLAQRYIDELSNRNEARQQQIEGCLALLGNGDEGIRTKAAEQLAFYVEAEPLAEQPEELKKAAQAWLEKLKTEK